MNEMLAFMIPGVVMYVLINHSDDIVEIIRERSRRSKR